MSEWLLMVLEDEAAHAARGGDLDAARARFMEDLRARGQLVLGGRLRSSREGKRVTARGVASGPFAEDGKALGAYYCVRAANAEEATKIANAAPALPTDEIDVRPLLKRNEPLADESKPGNVFAFAVIGNAPNEAAWVEVMSRIAATGTDRRETDEFLGSVRLQPPTTGKRVATRGGQRVVLDGPFLESKEVIGGIFFMRMPSIGDAVAWVSGQRFLAHGGVEIRQRM